MASLWNPSILGWKFPLNSARSHCLLRGHMTSNNETVSHQNLWSGNIAKNLWRQRVTIQCYPWMLTDDRRYSEVQWISRFKISSYITNHLKTGPLENNKFCFPRISMFPSGLTGNKIYCFPYDQSWSVYCCTQARYIVARALHKLLGNFLAASPVSSNLFRFEQLFAFWAISIVIF